jgi:hypothetical protein
LERYGNRTRFAKNIARLIIGMHDEEILGTMTNIAQSMEMVNRI